eukprot:TRINITY_DN10938_c0_g1_i1.p1 TRINITY_DN10938_c0_g1~~TRINITY_DN10938_c0_g1_i1.p1  ORF type:complete len:296 (+),score=59.87 TRINITY_DN10938_c0_g1_i1:43-930(+)
MAGLGRGFDVYSFLDQEAPFNVPSQNQWSRGGKRKSYTLPEGIQKIKRTVGWYNHNGNLGGQIVYRDIRDTIEAINPKEALKILKELEVQGSQIRNPTAYVMRRAEAVGPDLDHKVRKTIAWYNQHGGLSEEIRYIDVRKELVLLQTKDQLNILKGLEGKGETIKNPTAWIKQAALAKAAELATHEDGYGEMSSSGSTYGPSSAESYGGYGSYGSYGSGGEKVKRTIGWYNNNGGLAQPIYFDKVAPALSAVGEANALQVLKSLEGKGDTIRDPTGWILGACERLCSKGQFAQFS